MNLAEFLPQAKQFVGQRIVLDGYFMVLQKGKEYFTVLFSSTADRKDPQHLAVPIVQNLAEIKKIIQVMPRLLLLEQGDFTNPPYYYCFPLSLKALVLEDKKQHEFSLTDISEVRLFVPYPDTMRGLAQSTEYHYQAEVDYRPLMIEHHQATRAQIRIQKTLPLQAHIDPQPIQLLADENRYARSILSQTVTITGQLHYIEGKTQPHFLVTTQALRHSMVGIGLLRTSTTIWWRPEARYRLVRAHLTGNAPYSIAITGQIDYAYARDEEVPLVDGHPPHLVFSQIQQICFFENDYLLGYPQHD